MSELVIFVQKHWVSIVTAIIGLTYLYLEYKASIWMWPASIVMAAFCIFVFYSTQLYATMAIYIYFLCASVYGWGAWYRNRNIEQAAGQTTDQETEQAREYSILRMGREYTPVVLVSIAVVAIAICFVLISFSTNPLLVTIADAVVTSLNIVALWMASRRWAEQWLLLIPANAVSGWLLYVQNDKISSALFIIYFVVSIFGYFKWRRLAMEQKAL